MQRSRYLTCSKSSLQRILTGITLVTLGSVTQAADINVPGDYQTIQQAINAAVSDDVIHVAPGVYQENISFSGKAITVRSTDGAASTTLQGIGGTVVQMGPGGTLDGFTVTGGQASFGAGMSVSGTGSVIRHNIFDANNQGSGGYGAAIGGNSSSPTIDGNIFSNNNCDTQGLSGVVSFVNSSSPRITNNIFRNNNCRGINMTLPSSGTPVVMNNTFVGNTVGIKVDRRIAVSGQIYRNNIIVNNGIGLDVDYGTEAYNPVWENNLVFGNGINYDYISDQTGVAGNISLDPLFVNQDARDYHLQGNSPAIDAGSDTGAPVSDFDGNTRPVDADSDGTVTTDIGAYESGVVGPVINGDVNGLDGGRVRCYNRTTRDRIDFVISQGSTSWDCIANGLEVNPGDRIMIRIDGNVQ